MLYNGFMKKKLISLALPVVLLVSVLSVPLIANAEDGSSSTSTTSTSSDGSVKTSTESTETETSDDSAGRASRIAEDKKKLKTALTDAIKVRIAARCAGAQALVKGKGTINKTATNARTKAYKTIVSDLQSLSTSLAAKGSDVTELNSEITVLQAKVVDFNTANTAYQNDLSDLSALDCKTDPTAFQAALQVTRTDQATVFTDATAIKTYVKDTIKPTLKTLKQQLEKSSSSDTSTSTSN